MSIYEGVGQSGLFLTYAMASSRSFWKSMPGRWAVSIIRLASAVRTNEAMAGSASSPSWAQASSNALAIISVWSGLKLVCESRDRIGMALLPRKVTRSLLPFRSQNKASREPCGPGSITSVRPAQGITPLAPKDAGGPGSKQPGPFRSSPKKRSAVYGLARLSSHGLAGNRGRPKRIGQNTRTVT